MNAEALALTHRDRRRPLLVALARQPLEEGRDLGQSPARSSRLRTDCDQDAVWLKVKVAGHDATCHTGRRSCFYRTVGP